MKRLTVAVCFVLFSFFLPATVHLQGPKLIRGPYLQVVGPDSAVVVWDTDVESPGSVWYGGQTDSDLIAADGQNAKHHEVQIKGLKPHTTYYYRVGDTNQSSSDIFAFRTAPGAGQATTFTVLGDTRTGHEAHRGVARTVSSMDPDFYINLGDLVEDSSSRDQWNTFFDVEKPLMAKYALFPVLGNHDLSGSHYFDAFHLPNNERWYTFDFGSVHVIVLDAFSPLSPETDQYVWLEADLARSNLLWKIVALHLPLYSAGPHGGDPRLRAVLTPVFEKYGVDLVFSGHDHDYERSIVNGINYIVSGGGGAPLSRVGRSQYTQYSESVYHAIKVEAGEEEIRLVGVRVDGSEFDPFRVAKIVRDRQGSGTPAISRPAPSGSKAPSMPASAWSERVEEALQTGAAAIGIAIASLAGVSLVGGALVLLKRRGQS